MILKKTKKVRISVDSFYKKEKKGKILSMKMNRLKDIEMDLTWYYY